MKKILVALMMLATMTAEAGTAVERFRQQDATSQLVLTEGACEVFPNPSKFTLYKAYALNIPTSEQYEGCWEILPDGYVHIMIIIADEKKVFEFKYPQQDFELRPIL